jgi:hypothetical protein
LGRLIFFADMLMVRLPLESANTAKLYLDGSKYTASVYSCIAFSTATRYASMADGIEGSFAFATLQVCNKLEGVQTVVEANSYSFEVIEL